MLYLVALLKPIDCTSDPVFEGGSFQRYLRVFGQSIIKLFQRPCAVLPKFLFYKICKRHVCKNKRLLKYNHIINHLKEIDRENKIPVTLSWWKIAGSQRDRIIHNFKHAKKQQGLLAVFWRGFY